MGLPALAREWHADPHARRLLSSEQTVYFMDRYVYTSFVPVIFSWDQRKERANRKKHGISFVTAIAVFDDPHQITAQDREVEGEPRWQTLGMIESEIVLVAHTYEGIKDEEHIRIISARKATRREADVYKQGV